jgi:2-polyprenyl-6-methoxyphenol hydroxylase-like FAD-dependent oxidoreductase
MRVAIIGAGIGGLNTAIALRRIGYEVAVFERAPQLREVGAGISLWTNAMTALDALGAGDAVRNVSVPLSISELRIRNGRTIVNRVRAVDLAKRMARPELVRIVHRAELVESLARLLPPAAITFGRECERMTEEENSVTIHFTCGHTATAQAIVGADGIRSAVRKSIGHVDDPRYAGYTCWRGIGPRPRAMKPGYLAEWWGRGRRFGMATLPGDRVYWFAVKNAPAGGQNDDEKAEVLDSFRNWCEPVPELIESTPSRHVFRNDILDRPPARPWSRGRIVLMGDAAHPTTPNLGQGGCMAIEDAVILAQTLVASRGDFGQAFRAFEQRRYARTAAVTKNSWTFGRLAQMEGAISSRFRDGIVQLLLPVIGTRPLVKLASYDVGRLPA